MIKLAEPFVGIEEAEAVARVLKSGWLTNGPLVEQFEEGIKSVTGWKHAIAANSATMASAIIFDYLNFGPMTRVHVPNLTFVSPTLQLLHRNVQVLVQDVNPDTFDIAPEKLRLSDWIMPTDYAGRPGNWYGKVIADSACSIPKSCNQQAAFMSFYATKVLTCGEGGMLLTNDQGLAVYARKARLHGISLDAHGRNNKGGLNPLTYDVEFLGFKAYMTDIAAAIGLAQLAKLSVIREKRSQIAHWYRVSLADHVKLQADHPDHANCMFPIVLESPEAREAVRAALHQGGIASSLHYPLLSSLRAVYNDPHVTILPTPNADYLADRLLSLPLHPGMSLEDVQKISATVRFAISTNLPEA